MEKARDEMKRSSPQYLDWENISVKIQFFGDI